MVQGLTGCVQSCSVPLVHLHAAAENALAGIEQNVAVRKQSARSVSDVVGAGETRTSGPGSSRGVVNGSLARAALVRASGENGAVRTQRGWSDFIRSRV